MRKMPEQATITVTTFFLSSLQLSLANSVPMSSWPTGCSKRNLGKNLLNGQHKLPRIPFPHSHLPRPVMLHHKAWGLEVLMVPEGIAMQSRR